MPDDLWYNQGLRFTCTQCGNCCTGAPGYVWFSPAEAGAIAAHLKITLGDFHGSAERYARQINGRWSLQERETQHGYDCVFLTRGRDGKAGCAIYPVRPMQCRTWPFWPENVQRPADWQNATGRCPGIAAGVAGQGKFYPVQQVRIIRDSNPSR